jgi:Family of unknown function (DUF5317)
VFVLYAIAAGLLIGALSGGSVARLGVLKIHWGPLIIGGLLFQVVLFSGPVAERVGDLGPLLYVASTGVVLVAVLRNWRIVGLPILAVGAASNAAAILANGGFMPASVAALVSLGKNVPATYSNSSVVAHPALELLTDIFAMPRPMPFANVFSIGDVFIAVGVGITIAVAMCAPVSSAAGPVAADLPAADPPPDLPPAVEVG